MAGPATPSSQWTPSPASLPTLALQHGSVLSAAFGAFQVPHFFRCATSPGCRFRTSSLIILSRCIPPGAPFCLSGEKAVFLKTCVLNDSSRLCCNCERQREQVMGVLCKRTAALCTPLAFRCDGNFPRSIIGNPSASNCIGRANARRHVCVPSHLQPPTLRCLSPFSTFLELLQRLRACFLCAFLYDTLLCERTYLLSEHIKLLDPPDRLVDTETNEVVWSSAPSTEGEKPMEVGSRCPS